MRDDDTITEADLNAYVDGQLTPERRAAVEAHLADDPGDRERVAAWQAQAATLQALYGHVADERPPARPGRGVAPHGPGEARSGLDRYGGQNRPLRPAHGRRP